MRFVIHVTDTWRVKRCMVIITHLFCSNHSHTKSLTKIMIFGKNEVVQCNKEKRYRRTCSRQKEIRLWQSPQSRPRRSRVQLALTSAIVATPTNVTIDSTRCFRKKYNIHTQFCYQNFGQRKPICKFLSLANFRIIITLLVPVTERSDLPCLCRCTTLWNSKIQNNRRAFTPAI